MSQVLADPAVRARWFAFFATVLPPQPLLILDAARAAVAAVESGADEERAVVAGLAAAGTVSAR